MRSMHFPLLLGYDRKPQDTRLWMLKFVENDKPNGKPNDKLNGRLNGKLNGKLNG